MVIHLDVLMADCLEVEPSTAYLHRLRANDGRAPPIEGDAQELGGSLFTRRA
jgi:hypothetical protein